jgi:hypothetical protein
MKTQEQKEARKDYISLISKAKSNRKQRIKLSPQNSNYVYYEDHHILPRALFPLWEKKKSNIVRLTAQENFEAHRLLCIIFPSPEMGLAISLIHNSHKKIRGFIKVSKENYEDLKKIVSKACSDRNKIRFQDSEQRKKQGSPGEKNPMYGKKHTKEAKKLIGDANRGSNSPLYRTSWWNNGEIDVRSKECPGVNWTKGRSSKSKELMSIKRKKAAKEQFWWTNDITEIRLKKCPDGFHHGRLRKLS